MIRVRVIDHVVLRSRNVERLVAFYSSVLGCEVERTLPAAVGLIQLRAGDSLIDIVDVDSELGRAGGGPPAPSGKNLDHVCLRIEPLSQEDLRRWLAQHGVEPGEYSNRYGAQGFGPSLYIEDPDGNVVELRNDLVASDP
ncbi:MAG: VOC family protein [Xanthomonadales bacterium]|nr:VOC family protein [Xanthomonadales bacterium]